MTSSNTADRNIADVLEMIAAIVPDRPALIHDGRPVSWRELDERADSLATWLAARGVTRGDAIAIHTYNGPEYFVALFACFKISAVPFNSNYRIPAGRLEQLWRHCAARGVVYTPTCEETVGEAVKALPSLLFTLPFDLSGESRPNSGARTGPTAASTRGRVGADGRSPDDHLIKCTGGTTGAPKALLWRQGDVFHNINAYSARLRIPAEAGIKKIRALVMSSEPPRTFIASPLIHGTGQMRALSTLLSAGCVVTVSGRFDPIRVLDAVEAAKCDTLGIVGDAFASQLVDTARTVSRWKLAELQTVTSSGARWSAHTKADLLRLFPHLELLESFGATEASGLGYSVSRDGSVAPDGVFKAGRATVLLDDAYQILKRSPQAVGRLAVSGRQAVGFIGDPDSTRQVFQTIDGARYALSSDLASWLDGETFRHVGRSDGVANIGGHKVSLHLVENVLRGARDVRDAAAIAVSDERLGYRIAAFVELGERGRTRPGAEGDLSRQCATNLASYERPAVIAIGPLPRNDIGKIDMSAMRDRALRLLAPRTATAEIEQVEEGSDHE